MLKDHLSINSILKLKEAETNNPQKFSIKCKTCDVDADVDIYASNINDIIQLIFVCPNCKESEEIQL